MKSSYQQVLWAVNPGWSGARAVQDMWPSVIRAVCVWLVGCGWLLLGGLFVVLFLTNPGWGAGGFMCTRFKCPQ